MRPAGWAAYYLYNTLRFADPAAHAQVASESANSSVNAPFHKFRWLHVPGSVHQGLNPAYGTYTYGVTPRYFDGKASMQPLDPAMTASVEIEVGPLDDGPIQLGFTRGYVQSQAFVNHFGLRALIRPRDGELLFDTSQQSGANAAGERYTYAQEYGWLGSTARERIFAVLEEVRSNPALRLDMFAYDLNEPDVLRILLELAGEGRVRIILDDAALHHNTTRPKPEDQFEALFEQAARAPAQIKRGKFGRYAHDKILVVSDSSGALKVLTGSTNFSTTGLYVNANHVLVFPHPDAASKYAELFETVWDADVGRTAYLRSPLAGETFSIPQAAAGSAITFAPNSREFAAAILDGIVTRIGQEATATDPIGTVLFAVMESIAGPRTSPRAASSRTATTSSRSTTPTWSPPLRSRRSGSSTTSSSSTALRRGSRSGHPARPRRRRPSNRRPRSRPVGSSPPPTHGPSRTSTPATFTASTAGCSPDRAMIRQAFDRRGRERLARGNHPFNPSPATHELGRSPHGETDAHGRRC